MEGDTNTFNNPKVSVVMPVYNREKYVAKSIESVLNQTYTNFEFLICDDGSKDSTWSILERYQAKDNRIKLLKNEKNLGIANTRNKLVENVKGKYLAILDSDDLWVRDKLEIQVNFLDKNTNYGMLCTDYSFIDDNGKLLSKQTYKFEKIIDNRLDFGNCIAHSTVMLRLSVLSTLFAQDKMYYNPSYTFAEDYELWCRIRKHTKIYHMNRILYHYRLHDKNTTVSQEINHTNNSNKLNQELIPGFVRQKEIVLSIVHQNLKYLGVMTECYNIISLLHEPRTKLSINRYQFEQFVMENNKVIAKWKHLKIRLVEVMLFQYLRANKKTIPGKYTWMVVILPGIIACMFSRYQIKILAYVGINLTKKLIKKFVLLGMNNIKYNNSR